MLWNPTEHSDQDNLTWCFLRSVEWSSWPMFLSVPVAPLLFVAYGPLQVILVCVVLNLLWATVRYRIVSVPFAGAAALFSYARWVTVPVAVVVLSMQHRWGTAVLALFWPWCAGILGGFLPRKIGLMQQEFMRHLGYERWTPLS